MLTRFHKHFGPAGLIVAIVALVAALAGGAIAANGGSDGKATASAKAKQGPRGPKGPKGATGAAGPAGPQGAKGDPGAVGANGTNGTNGTNGAGVTSKALNPGDPTCEAGGSEFKAGSGAPTYACNGEEGAEGPEGPAGENGDPWTVGGTLPPGESETGTWTVGATGVSASTEVGSAVSFPIPLKAAGEENEAGAVENRIAVTYVKPGDPAIPACPGTVEAPEAAPGNLCVYQTQSFETTFSEERNPENNLGAEGTGKSGVILYFLLNHKEALARGNWILTAPLATP